MTRVCIVSVAAAFGLLTICGSVATAQTKTTTNTAGCFIDDGYGRIRSCSQRYKRDNPNWQATEHCYVDDGNGRYRSCAGSGANFKRKRPKS
jgi:hypothetical protein